MKSRLFISLFALFYLCNSCRQTKKDGKPEENLSVVVSHFSIKDSAGLIILNVYKPFSGSDYREKYILYPKEAAEPNIAATHLIPVPVNSVAINSTTHLGFLNELEMQASVKAATNPKLYYDRTFREAIAEEKVRSIGEQELNTEQLLIEKTEVLFHFLVNAGDLKKLSELRSLNQKVILIAEYMEQDPLKKAEWLKFFACFYGKEARHRADSIFDKIKKSYNEVKTEAFLSSYIPGVMIGLPWKGDWYVSGGNSYQSKLIKDAGGNYLWRAYETEGSIPLNIEKVYLEATRADIWINPGIAGSKAEIISMNEEFSVFKAFQKNKIYTNYKRSNKNGANDYWESGVVRPDLILKDLYTIFKGKNDLDTSLTYYKKLL